MCVFSGKQTYFCKSSSEKQHSQTMSSFATDLARFGSNPHSISPQSHHQHTFNTNQHIHHRQQFTFCQLNGRALIIYQKVQVQILRRISWWDICNLIILYSISHLNHITQSFHQQHQQPILPSWNHHGISWNIRELLWDHHGHHGIIIESSWTSGISWNHQGTSWEHQGIIMDIRRHQGIIRNIKGLTGTVCYFSLFF